MPDAPPIFAPIFAQAICAARRACATCRASAAWRLAVSGHYQMPVGGIEICPEGITVDTLPPAPALPPVPPPWDWSIEGPRLWGMLFAAARAGQLAPAVERMLGGGLPCGECGTHLRGYLAAHPVPAAGSGDQFPWLVDFKNAVNVRLGKPTKTIDEARAIYARGDGGQG